jgi:hypothetical protein
MVRAVAAFKAQQPHARRVFEASLVADEVHRQNPTYRQMFDLPRTDMAGVPLEEAYNSGNWGGYLATQTAEGFSAFFDLHANPRTLPLLLVLLGPALHIAESGARTRLPPRRASRHARRAMSAGTGTLAQV